MIWPLLQNIYIYIDNAEIGCVVPSTIPSDFSIPDYLNIKKATGFFFFFLTVKCIMAIYQFHAVASCTYHLSSPSCSTRTMQKIQQQQKKQKTKTQNKSRKSNRTRQMNKRRDSQTAHAAIPTDSRSLLRKEKSGMGSPDWNVSMVDIHLGKLLWVYLLPLACRNEGK